MNNKNKQESRSGSTLVLMVLARFGGITKSVSLKVAMTEVSGRKKYQKKYIFFSHFFSRTHPHSPPVKFNDETCVAEW